MLVVVVVAALLLVSALPGLHTSPAFLPEDFQYDMEAAAPNQYEDGYLQGEAVMEEPTLVPASDEDDDDNHNHMMTVLTTAAALCGRAGGFAGGGRGGAEGEPAGGRGHGGAGAGDVDHIEYLVELSPNFR